MDQKDVDYLNSIIEHNNKPRILFVMPETAGDVLICTSLLPDMKNLYPEFDIYFATKPAFFPILEENTYIHKTIEYRPCMDQELHMEGIYNHHGWFDIAFLPRVRTQMVFSYHHNRYNRWSFDLFTDNLKARRDLIRLTL